MVVDGLVFLTVCLVEGVRVARMLELIKFISDVATGSEIAKTYEDGSPKRRVNGGRDEVGGNRNCSRALAPAVLCV